jgi:DEAD/DEAH box helicase domain-containing protein
MVESQQYHVDNLDLEGKQAYVRKVDVDYYTDAMTYTNVRVIDVFSEKKSERIIVEHGEVQVVRKVVGYKKIKFYTSENLGYGDVSLPEKDMHTTSYWFTIPRDLLNKLPYNEAEIIDGLSGLAYCLYHLSAMILMADVRDIDRCIGDKSGEWFVRHGKGGRTLTNVSTGDKDKSSVQPDAMIDAFDPTVFIFDAYPGGIGFSELLFEQHDKTLSAAGSLIKNCSCSHGCPSCVGPSLEVGPFAKETALAILNLIMT